MTRIRRRELIAGLLGAPIVAATGCSSRRLPSNGELLSTRFAVGHQIRDRKSAPHPTDETSSARVVIVGGGAAGLSAAWRLKRAGFDDFVVLELEDHAGGTARGGESQRRRFPWGAHYIPVPMPHNRPLINLLREMQVVEAVREDGSPVVGEQFLCRDPEERLFVDGVWEEGMYPFSIASETDLQQLDEFRSEINRWVAARDDLGRRMFAVPRSAGSDCDEVRELDKLSFAQWMDARGWDSLPLRWMAEYACRDDYGLSLEKTSAWAGLFYFASRMSQPDGETQEVITWPDGNGRVIRHLSEQLGDHIRTDTAVFRVEGTQADAASASLVGMNASSGEWTRWSAERVIFSAPQMLARHVIPEFSAKPAGSTDGTFRYGSWVVANVHLSARPADVGFPLAWDNVVYDSTSLGYVTATHQLGIDHGPTILTWYHPFADVDPVETRKKMQTLQWSDWADFVMEDLQRAHPDINSLVQRIDVMLWGHAMIQPQVGFAWSDELLEAKRPRGRIHFAGTDLSGIALFEEAMDHGVRAAEEVLAALGEPSPWLENARKVSAS